MVVDVLVKVVLVLGIALYILSGSYDFMMVVVVVMDVVLVLCIVYFDRKIQHYGVVSYCSGGGIGIRY